MRRCISILAAGVVAASTAWAGYRVTIPMNAQINVGRPGTPDSPSGNAIYLSPNEAVHSLEFRNDEVPGYTRLNLGLPPGGGSPGYYFGPYIDLWLAGYNPLDVSQPGARLELDARFFQDINTNGNPYHDAPIFVRLYTYDVNTNSLLGYRNLGMVYQTGPTYFCTPKPPGGMTWSHVVVPLDNLGWDSNCDGTGDVGDVNVNGVFDPTHVTRIGFWGTDWDGGAFGDNGDFIDFKNVKITVPCKADLTGDDNTDLSDLALLLANYACSSVPVAQFDSGGFSGYNTGTVIGQHGWVSTTYANGGDPNVYFDPTIVADPTGSGHGNVMLMNAPNGDMNGWVGAMVLLGTPITSDKAIIEWDQYRVDLSDNIWYSDDGSYGGWWSLQWDQTHAAHAETFGASVPLTAGIWQHVKYTFNIPAGTVQVDVDGIKAQGTTTDNSIAGIELEDQTTPTAGHGEIYFDNLKISYSKTCIGDFNGGGNVELEDLAFLLSDYGCTVP